MERLEALLQLELVVVLAGLAALSWILYRLLLKNVSRERHKNLRGHFWNLSAHFFVALGLFGLFTLLRSIPAAETAGLRRTSAYVGLATLIWGLVVFVKTCRIFLFEYLFLSHMRVGVPLLLVNLLSLVLTISLGAWVVTEVFGVNLAPLLATSAVFSIVIGLAMQDTLGNLFAGVALQIDKPFELGDWIEVHNGGQIWIGQVFEISWRATVLTGFQDQKITIPNRIIAQAQVSNFSDPEKPIWRSHVFRIPFDAPLDEVRLVLLESALLVHGVCDTPSPLTLLIETSDSWISLKLIYAIRDYGAQYVIGDQVQRRALESLAAKGFSLGRPQLEISRAPESPTRGA